VTELPGDWSARRRAAFVRDEFQCQHCGAEGGQYGDASLECHHILPRRIGGSHELENLLTLCETCHKQIHRGETGSSVCEHTGGGPTKLGAAVASVTGVVGRPLARFIDAVSLGLLVLIFVIALGTALPHQSPQETLTPIRLVTREIFRSPGVAAVWIGSFVWLQLLIAAQPVVRSIPSESVPEPPAGRWSQWFGFGLLLVVIGLAGMTVASHRFITGEYFPTLSVLTASYNIGLAVTLGAGSANIFQDASEITPRWRQFSILTSCVIVGATAIMTAIFGQTVPIVGLSVPMVTALLLFSHPRRN